MSLLQNNWRKFFLCSALVGAWDDVLFALVFLLQFCLKAINSRVYTALWPTVGISIIVKQFHSLSLSKKVKKLSTSGYKRRSDKNFVLFHALNSSSFPQHPFTLFTFLADNPFLFIEIATKMQVIRDKPTNREEKKTLRRMVCKEHDEENLKISAKITSCLALHRQRIGSSISCISWMLLCCAALTLTCRFSACLAEILTLKIVIKYRL